MSRILSLVPEEQEAAFNQFVNNGIDKIKGSREFCGLSMSDLFLFVLEDDLGGKMLIGSFAKTINKKSTPDSTFEKIFDAYEEIFTDFMEKFIDANASKIHQGFIESRKEYEFERVLEQHQFPKTASYF